MQRKKCPPTFFAKAARSWIGPLKTYKGISYARALKIGQGNNMQNQLNMQEEMGQAHRSIEAMMMTLQESMMDFISILKTSMQSLMQNQ